MIAKLQQAVANYAHALKGASRAGRTAEACRPGMLGAALPRLSVSPSRLGSGSLEDANVVWPAPSPATHQLVRDARPGHREVVPAPVRSGLRPAVLGKNTGLLPG